MVDDNYTFQLVFNEALRERPQRSDLIGVDGGVLKASEAVSGTIFSTQSLESPILPTSNGNTGLAPIA
jgi:hypothetical protein